MEVRQLRALVALAEERHFTRAAARLHIAQPALSQQLQKLEQELGLALVDRTTRRVALTEAGTVLVARARTVLAEVDAARGEMQERVGVQAGNLTIGMTLTPGPVDVPKVLARFHRRYPGISLSLREGLSTSLADDLRGDVLDVAFLTDMGADEGRGLELTPLVSEALVLVTPRGHRLAGGPPVSVAELREERFVSFRERATIRAKVHEAAARAGFTPHLAFEANDVTRVRALVAEGLGVAILPKSDAERPGPAVSVVAVSDPSFVHRISLALRAGKRHAPGVRAFVALNAEVS